MTSTRLPFTPWICAGILFAGCVSLMAAFANTTVSSGDGKTTARHDERRAPAVRSESLKSPREIDGIPCARFARYASDGQVVNFVLAREHAFGRVMLPANTQVSLRRDRSVADVHLGKDATFDGHSCLGRGPTEWMTGFYPDGTLEYCFLSNDELIDGVPCRKGTFWGEITGGVIVQFHPNGRLASCRLSAAHTLDGRTIAKGERIHLDDQGRPIEGPSRM